MSSINSEALKKYVVFETRGNCRPLLTAYQILAWQFIYENQAASSQQVSDYLGLSREYTEALAKHIFK